MPTEIPLDARFADPPRRADAQGPTRTGDQRPGAPNFRIATSLGEDPVILDFRWNSRANDGHGAWFMDVRDEDESPIALGVKLVLGVNLCRTSTHPIFQRNVLRLYDTTQSGREATLDDLGTRVVLLNFTSDELYP